MVPMFGSIVTPSSATRRRRRGNAAMSRRSGRPGWTGGRTIRELGRAVRSSGLQEPKTPRYATPLDLGSHALRLEDGGLLLCYESWLSPAEARDAFEELRRETPWKSESIRIAGKLIRLPRLTAWVGDPEAGTRTGRSGTSLRHGRRGSPTCASARALRLRPAEFGLLNYYRNGRDSMGWHADDERESGRTR